MSCSVSWSTILMYHYQTPASGLGSGNLCSRRVFRYPTALASYFEVNGSDLVLLQWHLPVPITRYCSWKKRAGADIWLKITRKGHLKCTFLHVHSIWNEKLNQEVSNMPYIFSFDRNLTFLLNTTKKSIYFQRSWYLFCVSIDSSGDEDFWVTKLRVHSL